MIILCNYQEFLKYTVSESQDNNVDPWNDIQLRGFEPALGTLQRIVGGWVHPCSLSVSPRFHHMKLMEETMFFNATAMLPGFAESRTDCFVAVQQATTSRSGQGSMWPWNGHLRTSQVGWCSACKMMPMVIKLSTTQNNASSLETVGWPLGREAIICKKLLLFKVPRRLSPWPHTLV